MKEESEKCVFKKYLALSIHYIQGEKVEKQFNVGYMILYFSLFNVKNEGLTSCLLQNKWRHLGQKKTLISIGYTGIYKNIQTYFRNPSHIVDVYTWEQSASVPLLSFMRKDYGRSLNSKIHHPGMLPTPLWQSILSPTGFLHTWRKPNGREHLVSKR